MEDDWDRSLALSQDQNSVLFPAEGTPGRSSRYSSTHARNPSADGKSSNRTLSELLRLHSEKGSSGKFSADEASRIADVLGQWINASSSPYEGEDDFFVRSQDDISVGSRKPVPIALANLANGRPRGRSESTSSLSIPTQPSPRPPSALGPTTPS